MWLWFRTLKGCKFWKKVQMQDLNSSPYKLRFKNNFAVVLINISKKFFYSAENEAINEWLNNNDFFLLGIQLIQKMGHSQTTLTSKREGGLAKGVIHKLHGHLRGRGLAKWPLALFCKTNHEEEAGSKIPKNLTTWFMDDSKCQPFFVIERGRGLGGVSKFLKILST